ncbi:MULTISPECIES: hypothetical protein [Mameliella]|uniref:hypothetical protein n=1 Tax=Mameliella TaxID=1434019 RepID=UPI00167FF744|nr:MULTISPECIES: hypothetical protein [Mameliella]MBW4984147.1 hypothetical protein [Mameliella sp. CS4]MDD9731617.1 hypothetical protein [Mameliella sp. AT18]
MMLWVMVWYIGMDIVQVEFETETLCEAAKAKLVEQHDIDRKNIACLKVRG